MEIRVEGRSPVGRLITTWVENVETNMTELEIDREDINDRKELKLYTSELWAISVSRE